MTSPISLEDLKARLETLKQEQEALERLIAVYEGQPVQSPSESRFPPLHHSVKSFSVSGRIVDAVIELIHKTGRQVGNKEILEYIEERGISLGDTQNKQATLAAVLSQEVAKKSARLRKVARGVFDVRQ